MTVSHNREEPLDEVEALFRSAHSYVQVSEDLRPRVLETVRIQRREQRTRRHIERLAVLVLTLAGLAASLRSWGDPAQGHVPGVSAAVGLWEADVALRTGDASWNLVESFTELRRRQAEVFRPVAPRPRRG